MTRQSKMYATVTAGLILIFAGAVLAFAVSLNDKVQTHEVEIEVLKSSVIRQEADTREIKTDVKELLRRNGGE